MNAATQSAGIVIVIWKNGWKFLVLRVYNRWDFTKGIIENNETPLQAAQREAKEETGLENLLFSWGNVSKDTETYGNKKNVIFFIAETFTANIVLPISPELGRPEHHEFRWVSYIDARRLLNKRLVAILDWANKLVTESK